jgi:hypothetical protein
MKICSRFCCVYYRAVDHTFSYLRRYLAAALVPVVLVSLGQPLLFLALAPAHCVALVVLFPGALLINFLGLRRYPSRSWRLWPERSWMAATLSVLLGWFIGIVLGLGLGPPQFLVGSVGHDLAFMLHMLGLQMLASTLALLMVWLQTPEGKWIARSER